MEIFGFCRIDRKAGNGLHQPARVNDHQDAVTVLVLGNPTKCHYPMISNDFQHYKLYVDYDYYAPNTYTLLNVISLRELSDKRREG